MKPNLWKELLACASKDERRPGIHCVHVVQEGADLWAESTDGLQLLRVPVPQACTAQLDLGGKREALIPLPVVRALGAGAMVQLQGDGWHVDGSTWAIPIVEANYPDTAKVLAGVRSDPLTVQVPVQWLRELNAKQWSRADRALLAHRRCPNPPRLGLHLQIDDDLNPPIVLIGDDGEAGRASDAVVRVREPADDGRIRSYRTRQHNWQPMLAIYLPWLLGLADKAGNVTLRGNATRWEYDPVAFDRPDGGVHLRMPLALHGAKYGQDVLQASEKLLQWLPNPKRGGKWLAVPKTASPSA